MYPPIRIQTGSVDDRKGRTFIEGTVIWAERRSGFLVTVGEDFAVLDTDAPGHGLQFLVDAISEAAGAPVGPPERVASSHIADMPGEGPVEVHWAFDPGRRDRLLAVIKEKLAGLA
jgi:hypothetical protein